MKKLILVVTAVATLSGCASTTYIKVPSREFVTDCTAVGSFHVNSGGTVVLGEGSRLRDAMAKGFNTGVAVGAENEAHSVDAYKCPVRS